MKREPEIKAKVRALMTEQIRDQEISGRNLVIEDCVGLYATFDSSFLKNVSISNSDFSESSFSECRTEGLSIVSSSLVRTSFRGTPLLSVGLDSSDMEGIILSENLKELRGARLDVAQAISIVRTAGAVID